MRGSERMKLAKRGYQEDTPQLGTSCEHCANNIGCDPKYGLQKELALAGIG